MDIVKGDVEVEKWFDRYLTVAREAAQISYQRQHKYGPDNIGMLGAEGLIPRIMDKVMRLKRALWDKKESYDKEEKVVDAALDLCNYALFIVMNLRGTWYNKPGEESEIGKRLDHHIGLDLDGTLAEADELFYTRFHIGKPIPGAKEAVEKLVKKGFTPFIFTCRGPEEEDTIKEWLVKNQFPVKEVICAKPPAQKYIDDRGIGFDGDWNKMKEVLDSLRVLDIKANIGG